MSNNVYKRYPFFVLDYSKANMSINKEIMYDGKDIYMNVNDNIIKASDKTINQIVDKLADELYEAIDNRYDTIDEMVDDYDNLNKEIDSIKTGNLDENVFPIDFILDKFKGLNPNSNLYDIINNKANIGFDSGVLSDNDFTDEYKLILDSAEFGAKKYEHPETKQCGYISPVQSVFGRTGDVIVTKEDFGLENADPNANNYIHPRVIQCNPTYVKSVNNLTMESILLTKGSIELGMLSNAFPSRSRENIKNKVDNQYLVMNEDARDYIKDRVEQIKAIPDIKKTCNLYIKIKSNPNINSNPMYIMTMVTIYKRTFDISRKYELEPTHSFKLTPGKYIVKVEGYDGERYIIKNKHINIYKDTHITIELKEEDYL